MHLEKTVTKSEQCPIIPAKKGVSRHPQIEQNEEGSNEVVCTGMRNPNLERRHEDGSNSVVATETQSCREDMRH
jgi:hypothetical protein